LRINSFARKAARQGAGVSNWQGDDSQTWRVAEAALKTIIQE